MANGTRNTVFMAARKALHPVYGAYRIIKRKHKNHEILRLRMHWQIHPTPPPHQATIIIMFENVVIQYNVKTFLWYTTESKK